MTGSRCLFLSHENDLHTAVVAKYLRDIHGIETDVIAANAVAGNSGMTFGAAGSQQLASGPRVDCEKYDLIWARRIRFPQKGTESLSEENRSFVNTECQAAFEGVLLATERPIVVNPLLADYRANNKLWQLDQACDCGFAVPETLCSNHPDDIRAFVTGLDTPAVVKKLRGTSHFTPLTLDATEELLSNGDALRAAPLMVQERIVATCHYRVHIFGQSVYAFRIISDDLDWRPTAGRGASACRLTPADEQRCLTFLKKCGLYCGVLDLIEDRSGRVVFLECNSQGQFLFIEQRSGSPLSSFFATFLADLLRSELR